MSNLISVQNLEKFYNHGKPNEVHVLKNISLEVTEGEIISIIGPSGSGKSTLLNILGGLDNFDHGMVTVGNAVLNTMSPYQLARYRNTLVGFVFQMHHLLPEFTALENIILPMIINGQSRSKAHTRAAELLKQVELFDRAHHKPHELSGGETQRVAICRALAMNPLIVLADEPTGNLDRDTGHRIESMFSALNEKFGQTFIIVTHSAEFASISTRSLTLVDGILQSSKKPEAVL